MTIQNRVAKGFLAALAILASAAQLFAASSPDKKKGAAEAAPVDDRTDPLYGRYGMLNPFTRKTAICPFVMLEFGQ